MVFASSILGQCRRYGRRLSQYATHGGLLSLLSSRFPFVAPDAVAPRIVGVELTNACNLKCVYCDAQHPKTMRRRGFMEESTLRNVLSQVRGLAVQTLRFIGAGEPTIHPQFVECIARAARVAPVVTVTTNGQLLTRELCTAVAQFIDVVEVSVDSDNDKTYEEARIGASFARLLENVELLRSVIRASRSRTLVHTRLMIRPSEQHRVRDLVAYWRRKADVVTSERVCDRHRIGGDVFPISGEAAGFQRCTSIFKMVGVNWNGDVPLCDSSAVQLSCPTGLLLGNINVQPLAEIWTCELIRRYRQGRRAQDYAQAQVCRGCSCVWR